MSKTKTKSVKVPKLDEVKLQTRIEALRKQLESASRKLVVAQNPELKTVGEKVSAAQKRLGLARRVLALKQKKLDRLKKELINQNEAVGFADAEVEAAGIAFGNLSVKLDKIKAGLGIF